jgi:hypothetical protein
MKSWKRRLLMFRLMLTPYGRARANILRKKKVFHHLGENVVFQPYKFGAEPHLISIHIYR